ncbi:hypothetical protein HK101_009859 [Irineochytrium annulatum]|nr:hypothetical protein HK101_009859 [Irineochytrium annulatum]
MPPVRPDEEAPWPLNLGHPPSYFDDLLREADKEARVEGLVYGLVGFAASLAAFQYARRIGYKLNGRPLTLNHGIISTTLSALVLSQLGTHYSFLIKHQDIWERRRREAHLRAEAMKRMAAN